jgi:hypothetical protein
LNNASSPETAIPPARKRRHLRQRIAVVARWLHIYLSMLGLFVLLFFSITGITLNHPDWFTAGGPRQTRHTGMIDTRWLGSRGPRAQHASSVDQDPASDPEAGVDRLAIVEHLRSTHKIHGALAEFTSDPHECVVLFKGPGYAADAFIDRASGRYQLAITRQPAVAFWNDLHKGRDTGPLWSLVIDAAALIMTLASLSGLVLLFYIRRRRVSGLLAGLAATLLVLLIIALWVP